MKAIIENLVLSILTASLVAGLPIFVFSQYRPLVKVDNLPVVKKLPVFVGGDTTEKSIKVDSTVNLSLCVNQGTVKINGWKRNEVRVYVHEGSKFSFNVREKSEKTGDPNWITIAPIDTRRKHGPAPDCIIASEVEIDVPVGASVDLKGGETNVTIDSVKKAHVRTNGGNISL